MEYVRHKLSVYSYILDNINSVSTISAGGASLAVEYDVTRCDDVCVNVILCDPPFPSDTQQLCPALWWLVIT